MAQKQGGKMSQIVDVKLNGKILPAKCELRNDIPFIFVAGHWIRVEDYAKTLGAVATRKNRVIELIH